MYGAVNCAHVTGVSSYVIFHIIQGQDPPGENWSAAGEEDPAAGRGPMEMSRKLVKQAATTDGVMSSMRNSSLTSASKSALVDGRVMPPDASAGVRCRSRGADGDRCGGAATGI